jgi:hypothetical protein
MSKLQNIKAIQKMMSGEHRMQTRKTHGFSGVDKAAERAKTREVGEVWAETDYEGNVICWWRQNKGYRTKFNVHPDIADSNARTRQELRSFPNCPKETCTCTNPTRLDQTFRKKTGMCEECVLSMETRLKIQGKYKDYEREKMRANAEAFFRDADQEVEVLKEALSNLDFVNSDGRAEHWEFQNPEAMRETIEKSYNDFKKGVLDHYAPQSEEAPDDETAVRD